MARPEIDHFRAVAMGIVPGWDMINRFGRNTDVDSATGTREDIWNGGGLYAGFPIGVPGIIAENLRLTSTSVQDAPAGTGLRAVRLYGLGADGTSQTEDVPLNGTTPAVTEKLWYRMSHLVGLSAGSTGAMVGTLTVQHNITTANIFSVLSPGDCCAHISAYTVPSGKEGLFLTADVTVSNNQTSAQEATGAVAVRPYGGMFTHPFQTSVPTSAPLAFRSIGGFAIPALTDVVIRSMAATSDNLHITAKFELVTYPEGLDY